MRGDSLRTWLARIARPGLLADFLSSTVPVGLLTDVHLQCAIDQQCYIEIFFRNPDQRVSIVFVIEQDDGGR